MRKSSSKEDSWKIQYRTRPSWYEREEASRRANNNKPSWAAKYKCDNLGRSQKMRSCKGVSNQQIKSGLDSGRANKQRGTWHCQWKFKFWSWWDLKHVDVLRQLKTPMMIKKCLNYVWSPNTSSIIVLYSPIARKEIFLRQLWFPPRLEIKELREEEDEWRANPCHTLPLLVLLKTWELLGS